MAQFLIATSGDIIHGVLAYVRDDYAFDFRPSDPHQLADALERGGSASLLVGTLQIEVAVRSRRALFVWGYHPLPSWKNSPLKPPRSSPGELEFHGVDLRAGVSESLVKVNEWPTLYDPSSGWVHIAQDPVQSVADIAVEFAEGIVCGLKNGHLVELWLRPVIE